MLFFLYEINSAPNFLHSLLNVKFFYEPHRFYSTNTIYHDAEKPLLDLYILINLVSTSWM